MANTYKWRISQLIAYPEYQGKEQVVFMVVWRLEGTDGAGHFGEAYGTTPITIGPLTPFTPYADLTEAQVITWLEDALGTDGLAEIKEGVDRAVSLQANPPTVTPPLPWPSDVPPPLPIINPEVLDV